MRTLVLCAILLLASSAYAGDTVKTIKAGDTVTATKAIHLQYDAGCNTAEKKLEYAVSMLNALIANFNAQTGLSAEEFETYKTDYYYPRLYETLSVINQQKQILAEADASGWSLDLDTHYPVNGGTGKREVAYPAAANTQQKKLDFLMKLSTFAAQQTSDMDGIMAAWGTLRQQSKTSGWTIDVEGGYSE